MATKLLFNFIPICESMQGSWGWLMLYRNKKYCVQGVLLICRTRVVGGEEKYLKE